MSSDEDSLHQGREKFTVERSGDTQSSEDSFSFFGPVLPPHFLENNEALSKGEGKLYGPTLPDNMRLKEEANHKVVPCEVLEVKKKMIGPEIPEHLKLNQPEMELEEQAANSEDDADNFGPSTVLMARGDAAICYKSIGSQSLNKEASSTETNSKRETWMTELPAKTGTSFGLLPRHFKSQILTDKESDTSVWTDTPTDKNKQGSQIKKKDHTEVLRMKRLKERDKAMEKLVKKAAKKLRKKESLLEMHLENMKKKKKKEAKKQENKKNVPERRPFDRNVDLQVRRIDERQKRAILNKSLSLNDRFSSGQSKFL